MVSRPVDVVALITFLTAGLIVTSLATRVRESLQELQDSREQLRLAIDTISAAVWSPLADGCIDFVNQRWLEYTGLPREESRGWDGGATIHPEDRAGFLDAWRAAVATGEALRDGSTRSEG